MEILVKIKHKSIQKEKDIVTFTHKFLSDTKNINNLYD